MQGKTIQIKKTAGKLGIKISEAINNLWKNGINQKCNEACKKGNALKYLWISVN